MSRRVATWVMNMMSTGGYPGLVFLMFLENVFPPIPSELILPLAGYLAKTGDFTAVGVVLAGTLGSLLGAVPLFMAGRLMPIARIESFVDRHARWTTISCEDVRRADEWFTRHGHKAVLLCRLVPGIRSLISLPAGMHQMKAGPFVLWTLAGSLLWSTILVMAGYAMGAGYERIHRWLDPVSWVVFGVILLWYLMRVIRGAGSPRPSRNENGT